LGAEPSAQVPEAGTTAQAAEAEVRPDAAVADKEKLEEQRQMLRDLMETKRERRESIPPEWTKRLAEVEATLRGEETSPDFVYSIPVEGHPQFDGSHPILRNLIPIKIGDPAEAERKLLAAEDLRGKMLGERAKAERALQTAKTPKDKKAAQNALKKLDNAGATKEALDALTHETIPELSRLYKAAEEAFGSAERKPPSAAPEVSPKGAVLPEILDAQGSTEKAAERQIPSQPGGSTGPSRHNSGLVQPNPDLPSHREDPDVAVPAADGAAKNVDENATLKPAPAVASNGVEAGKMKSEMSGEADGQPWVIRPARYAKKSISVSTENSATFKTRVQRLAEAHGGKWSNREKAYILPAAKRDTLIQRINDGWDADLSKKLIPPKDPNASTQEPTSGATPVPPKEQAEKVNGESTNPAPAEAEKTAAVAGKEPWEMTAAEAGRKYVAESLLPSAQDDLRKAKSGGMTFGKLSRYPSRAAAIREIQGEIDSLSNLSDEDARRFSSQAGPHGHYGDVRRALEAGKSVPPEVLADYPDLQPTDNGKIEPVTELTPEELTYLRDTFKQFPQKANPHGARGMLKARFGEARAKQVSDAALRGALPKEEAATKEPPIESVAKTSEESIGKSSGIDVDVGIEHLHPASRKYQITVSGASIKEGIAYSAHVKYLEGKNPYSGTYEWMGWDTAATFRRLGDDGGATVTKLAEDWIAKQKKIDKTRDKSFSGTSDEAAQRKGSTPEALTAALAKSSFARNIRQLIDSGLVEIKPSHEGFDGLPPTVTAYWDPEVQKAVLLNDRIPVEKATGKVAHELTHAALEPYLDSILGKGAYSQLQDRFDAMLKARDPWAVKADGRAQAALQNRRKAALAARRQSKGKPEAYRIRRQQLLSEKQALRDERLAYMMEEYVNATEKARQSLPGRVKRFFADLIAAIRAAFYRSPFYRAAQKKGFTMELSPADIAALVREAADWLAKNGGPDTGGQRASQSVQYSDQADWSDTDQPEPTKMEAWSKAAFDLVHKGWDKGRAAILGAMTVRQVAETGKHVLPNLPEFVKALQRREADQAHIMRDADLVQERWKKHPVKILRRMAKVIHDATLADVHPGFEWSGIRKVGDKYEAYTQAKLKGMPRAVFPFATQAEAQQQLQDIQKNLSKAMEDPDNKERYEAWKESRVRLKDLPASAQAVITEAEQLHRDLFDAKLQALIGRIETAEVFGKNRQAMAAKLRKEFESKSLHWYYAPLTRQGSYWAYTEDKAGERTFKTFETQNALETYLKDMKGETIVGRGKTLENLQEIDRVDEGFVQDIQAMLAKTLDEKQADDVRDQVYQMYLATLPDVSMRKHSIHRKGTKGFEEDALRSFAQTQWHGAKQLANLRHNGTMLDVLRRAETALDYANHNDHRGKAEQELEAAKTLAADWQKWTPAEIEKAIESKQKDLPYKDMLALRKRLNEWDDPQDALQRTQERLQGDLDLADQINLDKNGYRIATDVLNELRTAYRDMQTPQTNFWVNAANNLSFLNFMGFSPAAALVNLLQTPGVAMPVATGRYGVGATTREFRKAYQLYGKALQGWTKDTDGNVSLVPLLTNPLEQKALQAFLDDGDISRTRAFDLIGVAEEGMAHGGPLVKLNKWAGFMFHHGERLNREVTLLAAFRLAYQKAQNFEQALQAARDINNLSHLDYSKENRARFMRGSAARVMFQFKSYTQGMYYLWTRSAIDAIQYLRGQNKEAAREGARTFLALLATHTAFAGALGLPFTGFMMAAANFIARQFDDDDEPFDAEREIRQTLKNLIGGAAAEAVTKGAFNAWTPLDLHSRLSLADLFFKDPLKEKEGRDLAIHYLAEATGPVGGILQGLFDAGSLLNEGQTWRAAESILPKVTKDALKGFRYGLEDARTLGGDKVKEMSLAESAFQGMGFSSANLSEKYDERSFVKEAEKAIEDGHHKVIRMMSDAILAKDPEQQREARDAMKAWNQRHPEFPVTGQSVQQSLRKRLRNQREMGDSGFTVNPKLENLREKYALH
jgi:hypothetical protein